jgi:hypothetical protein
MLFPSSVPLIWFEYMKLLVGGNVTYLKTYTVANRPKTFELFYIMDTLLHITSAFI